MAFKALRLDLYLVRVPGMGAGADRQRMVLSTIHVSQAHILEKQSRCRTVDFPGSFHVEQTSKDAPSGFFLCWHADHLFGGKDVAEVDFVIERRPSSAFGDESGGVSM